MPACPSCGQDNPVGAKFCLECGMSFGAARAGMREQRKTVTVLFCDLTGSTALGEKVDPERLRALLAEYFERMKAIVELHGGTVEKFIGDAVMAVFGVPLAHEDDALRAVRTALQMRETLTELALEGRIGLTTGEVVTGTEERLATGDAVNVAKRLEEAAHAGEILIGAPTHALVRDGVEVETIEPLTLKGKAARVPAHRLLRLRAARGRQHAGPFVGRGKELAVAGEIWERVLADRICELVTFVGEAGVGKSRLAAEFSNTIDATVVRGRCLPYGNGITYWPVVEALKQLDVLPNDAAAVSAVRSLLGETEETTSTEEIAWAFRKVLERAAEEHALVVLFDDIQWGEQTFLDLVEHVALLSSGAPILVLCLARPELTEHRPTWPITFRLDPLPDHDVEQLIPTQVTGRLRGSIKRTAAGNPLFVEEMVSMAGETEGEVRVPPTLQALLAARLDQLEAAERTVLECAAIEGELFHRGAVQALVPRDVQVTPRLAALVRKRLIEPCAPQIPGEDGFRFRHLLIRDAAYDAQPKAVRAELHHAFAAWLEERGAELVEQDELLGYHLEQACAYRAQLDLAVDPDVSAAARARLASAGRRASQRADYSAAASLLARATAFLAPEAIDLGLENDLVESLFKAGRRDEALRHVRSLSERAKRVRDPIGELCGGILLASLQLHFEPRRASDDLEVLVERALPVFEAADDDAAMFIGYVALGQVANVRGRMDEVLRTSERAAAFARRAGLSDTRMLWRAVARFWGSTPAVEVLAWLEEQEGGEWFDYLLRNHRAGSLAMLGRLDEARAIMAETRGALTERGRGVMLGLHLGQFSVDVELLAGDPATAVELGRQGCRLLEEIGETGYLSTAAGYLARALYAFGRHDEADAWAGRAAQLGAEDDLTTQIIWRQVRAKVLARRGTCEEARTLGREALALAEATDMLNAQGDAYADVGAAFRLCGDNDKAVAALERAIDCYERKGNLVSTRRARALLVEARGDELTP